MSINVYIYTPTNCNLQKRKLAFYELLYICLFIYISFLCTYNEIVESLLRFFPESGILFSDIQKNTLNMPQSIINNYKGSEIQNYFNDNDLLNLIKSPIGKIILEELSIKVCNPKRIQNICDIYDYDFIDYMDSF